MDISLAALLGENIYNFGELLQHPIVSKLSCHACTVYHMLIMLAVAHPYLTAEIGLCVSRPCLASLDLL